MAEDPVRVVREVRPEGQRHLFGDDRAAQVQQAPGVLPGADAPAFKGPFPVECVVAEPVDDVAGAEARLVAGFHVGGAVREEIRIPAQVRRVEGDVADFAERLLRDGRGADDMPGLVKQARRVGQAVLPGGKCG